MLDELTSRGHFTLLGKSAFRSAKYLQSIDDFIESIHARNGFSRQRMTHAAAREFDDGVRALVGEIYPTGIIELQADSTISWGHSN